MQAQRTMFWAKRRKSDIIPTKRNQVKKRGNSSQKPHKYDVFNFSASPQKEKRIVSFHPALAEK